MSEPIEPKRITPSPTTAADLIAMLEKLPPETHVYVDIGSYDWSESHRIELMPAPDHYPEKAGAYHLRGLDEWE